MEISRNVTQKRYFPGQTAKKFSARDGKSAREDALYQSLFQSRTEEEKRQEERVALVVCLLALLPAFVITALGLTWVG